MKSATLEEQVSHVPTTAMPLYRPRPPSRLSLGPISFIFCLANAAILVAAISGLLEGQQSYYDLVGGSLAWRNADKGFDFRVLWAFLATFGLLLALVVLLGRRFQRSGLDLSAMERALGFGLIPAALWLGSRLPTNSFGEVPIESLFLAGALLILLFFLSAPRLAATSEEVNSLAGTSLFVLLFGFFGGLGLATTLSRFFHIETPQSLTIGVVSAVCGLYLVTLLAVISFSETTTLIEERLGRVLFGAQLPLALLWCVVIPPAIIAKGQRIFSNGSVALAITILVAAASNGAALFYRWKNQRRLFPTTWTDHLVPWAIAPIAVFLATDHTVYPTFFGDDFHTGEHLLPWQQLFAFGKLPFVGFIPVHPLMDFFVSGVNALFFDGTLANYGNSRAILFAVAAALTFLSVARFANVGLALCLAVAANAWDRLLVTPIALVILCTGALLGQSKRWLICWLFICPLALCYNPAAGVALTLASLPVAIVQTWRFFRKDRQALLRLTACCAAAVIAVFLIPSTRAMSLGFAHFLLENSRSVTLVHGIEWQLDKAQMSSVRGVFAAPVVWEMFRFSWILAMVTAGTIFVLCVSVWRSTPRQGLAISAMGGLFLLFLSGWTINRIDPSTPSRTGEVSYLACLYIIPLAFFAFGRWRNLSTVLLLFIISFFRSGMADFTNSGSKPHSRFSTNHLLEKPSGALTVTEQCISIEGAEFGLPNLGHIYAPKGIFDAVVGLKTALNDLLKPGETYLDLSGRLATYFYLGMPVATSCGAPWLAASTVLQNDLLAEVKSHPAPVVWIGPGIYHAAEGPSVRTYRIYRMLLRNYVPCFRNGCIFFVLPERLNAAATPSSDEQIKLRYLAFGNENIGSLSVAWGRSWQRLGNQFIPIQKLRVTERSDSNRTNITLSQDRGSLDGATADFMRFDFLSNLPPTADAEIEIAWKSENGPNVGRFHVANGVNLVPLGLFPEWLASRHISDLNMCAHSTPNGFTFAIHNPELLRLKD